MNIILQVKEIIVDAIFPNVCLCGKWGVALCDECAGTISLNKKELCPICRRLSENGKTCTACRGRSYLTGVMVLGKYEKLLKKAVWRHKYEFIKDLAAPLAELLFKKYSEFLHEKKFVVIPVPASPERLNWRGFNQSELLGIELSRLADLDYLPVLRKNNVAAQVGLRRKERLKNMAGAISIIDNSIDLRGKKILLIDDVYTTGATLESCAKELRRSGAREVWGMVLARE